MEQQTVKCKECGTTQDVSRNGWVADTWPRGKHEVRYFEWIHVVGHWRGKRMCPGSGTEPSEHRRRA